MTDQDEVQSMTRIADRLPVLEERVAGAFDALQSDRRERDEFQSLVRSAIKFGALVLAVVVLVGLGNAYGVWNIIDGRSTSRDSQRQILDCTKPDGQCFKESAAREAAQTAEISRRVGRTQVDLIACSYRAEKDYRACADLALRGLAD